MKKYLYPVLFVLITVIAYSCNEALQQPKPSTYLRANILPFSYNVFSDNDFPFTFEYPDIAKVRKPDSKTKSVKWLDLYFPEYKYFINISYVPLTTDTSLQNAVNDCYTLIQRHAKLSGGIIQEDYQNIKKKSFGTVFEIKGRDVVSPYQFYVTDSSKYFLRIALNADFIPNNDSCDIVIKQLKKDMSHILHTLNWK